MRVVRFGVWVVVVLALMLVSFGFGVDGVLCGLYNMVWCFVRVSWRLVSCGFAGGWFWRARVVCDCGLVLLGGWLPWVGFGFG